MKKLILSLSAVTIASTALAVDRTYDETFSWTAQEISTDNLNPSQLTTGVSVAGFQSVLGTLTKVTLTITSGQVYGFTTLSAATAKSPNSFYIDGTHSISINGLTSDSLPTEAATKDAGFTVGPGSADYTTIVFNLSTSSSDATSLTGWTGGTIPVLASFDGNVSLVKKSGVTIVASPVVKSFGAGKITYTYTEVPEAETYVAGIALAGMVGYGFYRRSRKA